MEMGGKVNIATKENSVEITIKVPKEGCHYINIKKPILIQNGSITLDSITVQGDTPFRLRGWKAFKFKVAMWLARL